LAGPVREAGPFDATEARQKVAASKLGRFSVFLPTPDPVSKVDRQRKLAPKEKRRLSLAESSRRFFGFYS
jgi:hypothetical protein